MSIRMVAAVVLISAAPAAAQDFDYGVANAQATQQVIIQGATNSNIIRGMYDGGAHVGTSGIYVGRPGPAGTRDLGAPGRTYAAAPRASAMFAAPAGPRAANIALPYRSTPALRQAAADGVVERASQTNPAAGKAVAQAMSKNDFPRIFAGIVRPFGYRTNDTADAVAAYTLLGWLIATEAPDPSPRAAQAVRAQVAQALSSNPTFADPETRGQLAEEMKILFVTLHAGWQSARREGNLRRYSDSVAAMFAKQSGNDLRAMRLTEQGFVRG